MRKLGGILHFDSFSELNAWVKISENCDHNKTDFIISDKLGNLRRTKGGFYNWELKQLLKKEPDLFLTTANTADVLIVADENNKTFKFKVNKIPVSMNYDSCISEHRKTVDGIKDVPLIKNSQVQEIWAIEGA